eukprot:GHRR01031203.1.p1 GENE.GHRR01031203.1~~GHRR01031203.1.p1  ORF type:complete len:190 (+),score=31.85 GHRR01031203.1:81-650(+)
MGCGLQVQIWRAPHFGVYTNAARRRPSQSAYYAWILRYAHYLSWMLYNADRCAQAGDIMASLSPYQGAVGDGQVDVSTPVIAPRPSQLTDQQQHSQNPDGPHPPEQQQEDFLTASLNQHLVTNVTNFFMSEVAPRSRTISEDVASLQYEAQALAEKAHEERVDVLTELDRLHKLVASFQEQIRLALGPM